MRNCGQQEKYRHVVVGFNHRLDNLQAAVLRVKLPHLDSWNDGRRRAASIYNQLLKDVPGVITPLADEERTHVYHLYVIQHPRRDELLARLKDEGVRAGLHYPIPVHLQPCYEGIPFSPDSLSVTELVAKRVISLPMYPELTRSQIEFVCDRVREFPAN
jgi:dTDP-4-amino-4,6-dideoxygalactose transaminase